MHVAPRRIVLVLGITLALVALIAALVHVPPVRRMISGFAERSLEAAYPIDVRIGSLDYNLATLRLTIDELAVAPADDPAAPFFESASIDLTLGASTLLGRPAIRSAVVRDPSVVVRTDADGRTNLPQSPPSADEPTAGGTTRIPPIESLTIEGLDVRWSHAVQDVLLEMHDIDLAMRATAGDLAGRLSQRGGSTFRRGDQESSVRELQADLAFDGQRLAISDLVLDAPEVRLDADATLTDPFGSPALDAEYGLEARVGDLAPWLGQDDAAAGQLSLEGTATGPLAEPVANVRISSDALRVAGLDDVDLDLDVEVSASAIQVDDVAVAVGDARLGGRGRLELAETPAAEASLTWENLDVAILERAAPELAPLGVATTLHGTADVRWSPDDVDAWELQLDARNDATRGEGMPLAGRIEAEVKDGSWRAVVRQRSPRGTTISADVDGRLSSDVLTDTTIAGNATVTTARLGSLVTELDLLDAGEDVAGAMTADVELGGRLGRPTVAGRVSASDVRLAQVRADSLEGRVRVEPGTIFVDDLDVRQGPNTLRASGSLARQGGAVDGTFEATLNELSDLVPEPSAWWPRGSATLRGSVGGSLDRPRAEAAFTTGQLDVAGQSIQSAHGTLRLDDQVISLDDVQITQRAGALTAEGRYALDAGRYSLTIVGQGLDVRRLAIDEGDAVPIEATASVDIRSEGTPDDPRGGGRITLADLSYDDVQLGDADIDLSLEQGRIAALATLPELGARLDAAVGVESPWPFDVEATLEAVELSRLAGQPPRPAPLRDAAGVDEPAPTAGDTAGSGTPRIAGRLTASATASGALDELAATRVAVDVQPLDIMIDDAVVRLEQPASIEYGPEGIAVRGLSLRAGDVAATVEGRLGGPGEDALRASVDADLRALADLAASLPGPDVERLVDLETLAGRVSLRSRLESRHDGAIGGTAELSVVDATVGPPDLPPATGVELRVRYGDAGLVIERLDAGWQGATVEASGQVPTTMLDSALGADTTVSEGGFDVSPASPPDRTAKGPSRSATITARLQSITADTLAPLIGSEIADRLDLAIDGTLELEAAALEPAAVDGRLTLSRADLAVGEISLSQDRPTVLALDDGAVRVADWAWSGTGNQLAIEGGADLSGDPVLDLDVRGDIDLRLAGLVLPSVATSGRSVVALSVGGAPSDPTLDGRVLLEGVEMRLASPRVVVTDLDGAVLFSGDRVEMSNVRGLANGGTLAVTGSLMLDDLAPADGALTIEATRMAMELPDGLRSEIDADVSLRASTDGLALVGEVTILRGAYREPLTVTNRLLDALQQRALTLRATRELTAIDRMRLDVAVNTATDIIVDNNYGQFAIGSDLRLIGTMASPSLTGRAAIREGGTIFLGGVVYRLQASSIDFTNPSRIEPELDLTARTRVADYDITLQVTGTPDRLETDLTSSPPLGQSDIVSLLVTGRTLADAGNAGAEVARDQVLGYISGEFAGIAGRAVGLDVLRFERGTTLEDVRFDAGLVATETDPSARLTFGKRLSRDLELIFSQSLRRSGDFTWIVNYSPIPQTTVRFVSRDNEDRSYEFWHDLSFGGSTTRGGGPARPTETVGTVRLVGSPGVDERELRDELELSAGESFDFYRWQDDRDRLIEYYRERGYLEARVRTRRVDASSDEGVTIEYEIERGPATELVVEGYPLSGDVRRAMRARWSRSIFDRFLVEDLERMARRDLADDGYFRAEARADVSEDSGVKRIVVRIEPGERVTELRLEFDGNASIDGSRLRALLPDEDALERTFVDPTELVESIEALYRDEGYIEVDVTAEEPRFEGSTGRLVLMVDEGAIVRLSEVTLEGVTAMPESEARAALGLRPGDVFSPSVLGAARQRLEEAYRRLGYNSVGVTVDGDREAAESGVALTATVEEGPRQTVGAIDVVGVRDTQPGVISRALGVTIGEPLDLRAMYRARKRLYDTGAFRSVDLEIEPVEEATSDGDGVQPMEATITVEEWPRYRLRYGFQINDAEEPTRESARTLTPGIVADLTRRNLFGRAIRTGVAARLQRREQTGRLFLSMPTFFTLPLTTSFFASRSRAELGADDARPFVSSNTDFTAEQRFRPTTVAEVAYGYTFTRNHTFERNPSPNDPFPFDITVNIARLTATATMDTRNDLLDATRGWFHSSSFEYASEQLGSDLRFAKYLGQQTYFQPLPADMVWATAVRLGLAGAFDQQVIPSERFFAGGGNTVRGYAEDSLGARSFLGDALGGEALFILNQELRVPIGRYLQGVGFFDAGRPFPSIGDFSLIDLDTSVGLGVRIRTPVVMLRIDYGQPLSTVRGTRPSGRWYFSIGQMF